MPETYVPIGQMYIAGNDDRPQLSYWAVDLGLTDPLIRVGEHVYELHGKLLCNVEEAAPEPTLADVIALLNKQAELFGHVAAALEAIAETVKGL